MSFYKWLMAISLSVLFGTSLIFFIAGIQVANDSNENILDNPSLSGLNSSMRNSMSSFSQGVDIQKNASLSEQVTAPTGAFILFSIMTSLGRFISLPITYLTSLFSAVSSMLGIDPAILGFISSLALLGLIFAWYRQIKQG